MVTSRIENVIADRIREHRQRKLMDTAKWLVRDIRFAEAGSKEDIQRLKQKFIIRQKEQDERTCGRKKKLRYNTENNGVVNWEALNRFSQTKKSNVQVQWQAD